MRLKKLILHGFKSFADRTEFVFDRPITGIVGPNGCGKSNVVDAFKWVLGEQSAKSLRGDAMMDVLFNGSSSRKPAGMVEVTLVFENPQTEGGKRAINLDTDEIAVGRRLFRDGTSEYQINNSTTRLKDVRELFLDTGVGVDAYSVIEQGRVSAMLDANPEERRLIFEEAAGISKFKARKKESERKLEKVDQNLLRVNDIVEEVEKRLRSVKIQATKARTFREHSTKLAELRLGHSLQEYHTHSQARQRLEASREEAKFRLDDISGDLASAQNALAAKKESFESLSQTRQRLEYELVQARSQIQSATQKQQYAAQQLEQIAEQLAGFEQDKAQIQAKLVEVGQSLSADTQTLAALTAELDEQRALIEQRQKAFAEGQLQLNSAAAQIEKQKSAILDLMRKLAANGSRLGAIDIERKNVASQQDRLNQRRMQLERELQTLESARSELAGKLQEITAKIAEQQADLEAKRAAATALGKHISQIGERLGAAKEHRSGLISRQKLLADLEAKREGVSEGVKSVLRQRETKFPFIRGLVADVLRVDVEHAHIIEAALDGKDQYLVTSDSDAALAAQAAMDELEGRVNILCADRLADSAEAYDWNLHPHRIRLAVDLVRFEPGDAAIAAHLLGRTVVVDDLSIARDLLESGPRGFRYVTTNGEILEANGVLRAGPLTAAMGLLSRRSELEVISQQIAEVDRRIEQLGRDLAEGSTQARTLEEDISSLRNTVYQSNTTKVELNSASAQNADRQNALKREQPVVDRELQSLAAQMQRLESEQNSLVQQRTQMEADQSAASSTVEMLTQQQTQIAEQLREFGEQLTGLRVHLGQVQEKQLACQQAVQRQTAAQAELGQQIERVERAVAAAGSRRADVQRQRQAAAHEEEALIASVAADERKSADFAGQIAEAGKLVGELSASVEKSRQQREGIEQELHDLELKAGEVRVRIETLVQRTLEESQLDLPARYAELTADGKQYDPGQVDWEAVAEEIRELREKIQRLGNVNVESIDEQDELEKRRLFLDTQVSDLTTSKAQLEQLINEINAESGVRFEQTFNAVREHFQGMFRKLFGGGKADIYLETELDPPKNAPVQLDEAGQPIPPQKIKVDILDAGIEIIARPPGKQPVSISQLSGGEKTMTCVALLMSIFKSKPSPFCILDEVDAALDEANNQRFNMIVQEFLDQSQFIVITHSKRTMQIADMLYGVTMQEQGVSKRVSVKFDQIDSQGRISETAAA
ncbi:MAG TPA: chromosome segregation protein SMC [Tepidisphaeraceae bacterium]|jgi:chromosome segregation protein|nr:chromosome segregation protein SMC [Tepidisphaeraceae bacterium]